MVIKLSYQNFFIIETKKYEEWVRRISLNIKGDLLASSSDDEKIFVWQTGTNSVQHELYGHSNKIECVLFLKNEKSIYNVYIRKNKPSSPQDSKESLLRQNQYSSPKIITNPLRQNRFMSPHDAGSPIRQKYI